MEHKVCNSFNNMYEAGFCITTFIDFVSDFLGGKGISISFCVSCLYLAMNVIRIRERKLTVTLFCKTDSNTILFLL